MSAVKDMYQQITSSLGMRFTLNQIQQYIEEFRDRPLYIRQLSMDSATTGCCVFLKDVNLIITRDDLDEMLELVAQSHEMAHILLHRDLVPYYPVTFEEFIKEPDKYILLKREYNGVYKKSHEYEAETLGRKIADCILNSQSGQPSLISKLFG